MMMQDVLAVVVTYNPSDDLECGLRTIRAQISHVLVVDNGSKNVDFVKASAERTGCECVCSERNLGIAFALNQGAAMALKLGATWLAMFDQDSELPINAIEHLLGAYEAIKSPDKVAILALSHRDRGTGRDYHLAGDILSESETTRTVKTTITSGSMLRLSVYEVLGPFNEQLFIDSVDLEYCMRARRSGYEILEARHVYLKHSIGNSELRSLCGRRITLTHHTADRRYYITRNQLFVATQSLRFDPRWSTSAIVHLVGFNLAALLFEAERGKKLWAMLQGASDFVFNRYGQRS